MVNLSHQLAARERGQGGRSAGKDKRVGATADSAADSCAARLAAIVDAEIIPRLMLAHRDGGLPAAEDAQPESAVASAEVVEFAGRIIKGDLAGATAHMEAIRRRGIALETVYLELLAPAARHMGHLWSVDHCDFTEVTLGLWRLQCLMHELASDFCRDGGRRGSGLRALLVTAPGEQHTFGLFMVAEFFRRAGWEVWGELPRTVEAIQETLRREWFDIAGISVGHQIPAAQVGSLVAAMRLVSANPSVKIIVGGPAFMQNPGLVSQVGADTMAADGRDAVRKAEWLAASQEHR